MNENKPWWKRKSVKLFIIFVIGCFIGYQMGIQWNYSGAEEYFIGSFFLQIFFTTPFFYLFFPLSITWGDIPTVVMTLYTGFLFLAFGALFLWLKSKIIVYI
jgi:hypothetical protein